MFSIDLAVKNSIIPLSLLYQNTVHECEINVKAYIQLKKKKKQNNKHTAHIIGYAHADRNAVSSIFFILETQKLEFFFY